MSSLINELEASLLVEEAKEVISKEQSLLENSIEEIGRDFVNLGRHGREQVIKDVINKHGENASVNVVKEYTEKLNLTVKGLVKVKDKTKLISCLEQLPLQLFLSLDTQKKEMIADRLLERNKWTNLDTINKAILHFAKLITRKEIIKKQDENQIHLQDSVATMTLNITEESYSVENFIKVL